MSRLTELTKSMRDELPNWKTICKTPDQVLLVTIVRLLIEITDILEAKHD